jgi:hypothetical protein
VRSKTPSVHFSCARRALETRKVTKGIALDAGEIMAEGQKWQRCRKAEIQRCKEPKEQRGISS